MCYFQREVQDSVGWVDKADPPTPAQKTLTLLLWKQTGDSVWRLRVVTLGVWCC